LVSSTVLSRLKSERTPDQGTHGEGERAGDGWRARRGTLRINGSEAGTNAEGTLPDTYLDMRGWGKGLLWVNGNNLGWFWASAGPQARPAGRRPLTRAARAGSARAAHSRARPALQQPGRDTAHQGVPTAAVWQDAGSPAWREA
jgi:hypothetical protein